MTEGSADVGIVVIARNEGDRLRRCLGSVAGRAGCVVYVDSGSTDRSPELARSLGAEVVELDRSSPFTAARARNEGFGRLLALAPGIAYVQFVDGDCEIDPAWLSEAAAALRREPGWAVVCGRLRERERERTIYNRLADMEWDGPSGEIGACGGIFMARAASFRAVGGFNPDIIAAEDDEFCLRLRRAGGKIVRLPVEMGNHDIAMTRFSQWWRRSVRTGHAYAEGAARHGRSEDRHFVPQLRGAILWGLALPAAALGLAWPTRGLSLGLLAGYPLLYHRIARYWRRRGGTPADARLYAASCVIAKFPHAQGAVRYLYRRLARRPARIIEYGRSNPSPTKPSPELPS